MPDLPIDTRLGRLGTTPSANDSESEDACSSPTGAGPLDVTGTWYDRECRPLSRTVATWSKSQQYRQSGHIMLEVSPFRGEIRCMLTVSWAQNLCRMVETFVPDGPSVTHVNAIKDMMHDGNPAIGANHIQNFKSQVITKRMLLLRVAATMGYPVQAEEEGPPSTIPASSFVNQRITRLQDGTTGWPRTFNSIRAHVQTIQRSGAAFAPAAPTHSFSSPDSVNYRALTMLVGARNIAKKVDYLKAQFNIQLAAFMLLWHCNVSLVAPRMAL